MEIIEIVGEASAYIVRLHCIALCRNVPVVEGKIKVAKKVEFTASYVAKCFLPLHLRSKPMRIENACSNAKRYYLIPLISQCGTGITPPRNVLSEKGFVGEVIFVWRQKIFGAKGQFVVSDGQCKSFNRLKVSE